VALRRIDAELVARGLAPSRESARQLVLSGAVEVGGITVSKASRQVRPEDSVVVRVKDADKWVSRGAHKLIGALNHFTDLSVDGKTCLDAGASTGGFTQVLLNRGARSVYAVDVGYGQLAWRLQSDERVDARDRINVRNLTEADFDPLPDLVVSDLSFISLRTVLPALKRVAAPAADLVLMVKPQFEVGKSKLGKNGVVRDPQLRADAVRSVAAEAMRLGLGSKGVVASPLPGPSGNVEYFLWLHANCGPVSEDEIAQAIDEGPQ